MKRKHSPQPTSNYRIPFSFRLFWSVFSMFLGFTVCVLLFQYQREREFAEEKLNSVLSSYNYQLYRLTHRQDSIQHVVQQFIRDIPQQDLRVTIIAPEGKVLFDNSATGDFANHNNRSEVRKARQQGNGFAIRSSQSTGSRYFYSATNLDGYIYRCALPWDPYTQRALTIDKSFVYFMALMLALCFFVLSRFTFSIGRTISKLHEFVLKQRDGKAQAADYDFPDDELGDISQYIVSLYHKQQQAKEELLLQRQIKRELTQNMAHELKTPVSSIQGFLETILHNPQLTEEKRQYFLQRCYAQSNRLTDLLHEISLLNRLDEAQELFERTDVNLSQMVHDIEKECAQASEEKGIQTDIRLPENLTIQGNYSLLYSIFRNLYDNAISYAGENIRILIECDKIDDQYAHFRFVDNGIGVDEVHVSRIFERFYRVDKGRSRKMGGTGLGLSIVKHAVQFHKGQITAESGLGKGLTIAFTLKRQ